MNYGVVSTLPLKLWNGLICPLNYPKLLKSPPTGFYGGFATVTMVLHSDCGFDFFPICFHIIFEKS